MSSGIEISPSNTSSLWSLSLPSLSLQNGVAESVAYEALSSEELPSIGGDDKLVWAMLRPTYHLELSVLKFPLSLTQSYFIGRLFSNDIILPSSTEKVPSAIIYVENEQIEIENISTPTSAHSLTIDDEHILINERKLLQIVSNDSELKINFGPYKYTFFYVTPASINFARKLKEFSKCVVCYRFWKEPFSLPCGHVACSRCCFEIEQYGLFVADVLNIAHKPVSEWPKIECPKCFNQFTVEEMNNSMKKLPILSTIPETISAILSSCTFCMNCANHRCVYGECDYWICEDCDCITCPVCGLESHRDHEVKYAYTTMERNILNYHNKSLRPRLKFGQMYSSKKNLIAKSKFAKKILISCQRRLSKINKNISGTLEIARITYRKLLKLEKVIDEERFDGEREDIFNRFGTLITSLKQPILLTTSNWISIIQIFETAGRCGKFTSVNSDDLFDFNDDDF